MSASFFVCLCVSNNPDLDGRLRSFELVGGTALDVLKKSRDLVHLGWSLASAPLYGNFKPNQQPYRTLVLTKEQSSAVDAESLTLIENAVRFYESSPAVRAPGEQQDAVERDFRYVDYMLMEETFKACGILLLRQAHCAEEVDLRTDCSL